MIAGLKEGKKLAGASVLRPIQIYFLTAWSVSRIGPIVNLKIINLPYQGRSSRGATLLVASPLKRSGLLTVPGAGKKLSGEQASYARFRSVLTVASVPEKSGNFLIPEL